MFDPSGLKAWYDTWLENASNFAAGFADTISFGATDWAREQLGWNDAVDHQSGAYAAGQVTGAIGIGVAVGILAAPVALEIATYWGFQGLSAHIVAGMITGALADSAGDFALYRDLHRLPYAFFRGAVWGGLFGGLFAALGNLFRGGFCKGETCGKIVGCFISGTLVFTDVGELPIEQIQLGDQVWSYNQQSAQWELAQVEATQQREYAGDLVTLKLEIGSGEYEEITCTGGHPFWVTQGFALAERPACSDLPAHESKLSPNGRWTEARWLRLGDKFLTRTGVSATVVGLTIRMARVQVYNLQVKNLQLYAVGHAGVLVHNSNRHAEYGTEIHKIWYFGPGFKPGRLPSGKRPDAIDWERRIVKDLKPNTPSGIRKGRPQLRGYARELDREFPGDRPWRTCLETYDTPAWW